MQEHQGGDRDVQYAMEAAYTSEAPPPAHGGDAYSQSLEPPMLSSFGEVEDARAPANGDPDKLNAEESAALRSFLAGGGESGEGVVLDWGVVLPLAQALAISLAFVAAIVGICTDSWKVGVSLGGHRAAVGLSELRVDADEPGAAGLLSLHDLCNGLVQPAVAAANGTVAASPMAAEMACAYKRAGAAVIGLVGAALALLAALLLTNLYFALAARGIFAPLQPLVQRLEARLAALPPAAREALPTGAWACSLFFLALALVLFGSAAPPGLGLGAGQLGLSFGAVRLAALLVCVGGAVHAASLSAAWRAELLAGISVSVAKWRALSDVRAKALLGLLGGCVALHLLLWARAVDWAVALPCLGIFGVLFDEPRAALAFCGLTALAVFFEIVDISADGSAMAKGSIWLQAADWLLLGMQALALGGVALLRVRAVQN